MLRCTVKENEHKKTAIEGVDCRVAGWTVDFRSLPARRRLSVLNIRAYDVDLVGNLLVLFALTQTLKLLLLLALQWHIAAAWAELQAVSSSTGMYAF